MTTYNATPLGRYDHLSAEERVSVMCQLRAEGHSLQGIADAFSLTRERVRQIIRDANGPSREEALAARRAARERRAAELREQAMGICRATPGISAEEVARQIGVTSAAVRRALGEDARLLLVAKHDAVALFSDEAILEHIRRAAQLAGQPLTVRKYEIAREQFDGASAPLVLQRFGSWRAACAQAGVAHGQPVRPNYARRWTREQLVASVAEYLLADGARGSFAHYEVWARQRSGTPSGQTIRAQLGRWSKAKSDALALLALQGGGAFGPVADQERSE